MEASKTKSGCTASSHTIGVQIARQLKECGIKYNSRVTSLGTGLGAGTRRNMKQVAKRLRAFRARRARFRMLRRNRIKTDRLLRTGGNAAMTFGQRALGVSDSVRLQQRRASAACTCVSSCGANLDLTLLLADGESTGAADPAFEAHVGVVYSWALAAWEKWVPRALLSRLN